MAEENETVTVDADNDWVKLVSNDGFSFVVKREVVMGSGTLSNMLSSDFTESKRSTCQIDERGIVVEKLLEYLMYKKLHQNTSNSREIPDFQERIIPEIGLELLLAADFFET